MNSSKMENYINSIVESTPINDEDDDSLNESDDDETYFASSPHNRGIAPILEQSKDEVIKEMEQSEVIFKNLMKSQKANQGVSSNRTSVIASPIKKQ